MNRPMMRRVELLRRHEDFAYQVAYFLLLKEESAVAAARQALLAFAADESFFSLPPAERENHLKRQVMKEALAVQRHYYAK